MKKPAGHNYDKTQARRQAKRMALFTQMRDALRLAEDARTQAKAKAIARESDGTYSLTVHSSVSDTPDTKSRH